MRYPTQSLTGQNYGKLIALLTDLVAKQSLRLIWMVVSHRIDTERNIHRIPDDDLENGGLMGLIRNIILSNRSYTIKRVIETANFCKKFFVFLTNIYECLHMTCFKIIFYKNQLTPLHQI